MNTQTPNYSFVPGYGEWHLIDDNKPEEVLFNIVDPLEKLFTHLNPYNEQSETDPLETATYNDVLDFTEDYINVAMRCAEENNAFEGIIFDADKVPDDAAEIMAISLYNYYFS